MGLINEQQRESSQVDKPNVSELDIKPVTSEAFSDPQAYSIEANLPIPEAKLEQVDPASVLLPQTSAVVPPASANNLPKLTNEVDFNQLSPYDPTVVNTQLPTFYSQPAYTPALSQANKLFQDITSRPQPTNEPLQTQANWAKQTLENNRNLLNTPDTDKPYHQAFTGWLGDVLFGTEQAQKETEQGSFKLNWGGFDLSPLGLLPKPIMGNFGRQGANVGGGFNYALSTPLNAFVGYLADVNVEFADVLQNFGIDKQTAQKFTRDGFLSFLPDFVSNPFNRRVVLEDGKPARMENAPVRVPKPSNILGFNFDVARKNYRERSNTLNALLGDPVGDIGDPKESTNLDTGRVFYNPRRKVGDSVSKDPLGLGLEIALNIFDPIGNKLTDPAFDEVFGLLFGKTPTPKVEVVTETPANLRSALPPGTTKTPEVQQTIDLTSLTEEQLRQQRVGTPKLTPAPERPALPQASVSNDVSVADVETIFDYLLDIGEPVLSQTIQNILTKVKREGLEVTRENIEKVYPRVEVVDAEIVPEYKANPSAPPAANPSKVVRIPISGTSVNQRLLPPAVDPALVPPSKLPEVLPVPKSNPTQTMLKIGIGTPSTEPVTDLGQLALRPYTQVVEQIQITNPKLLEGYNGVTWNDLKAHLSRQPNIDLSEFNVVGSELPKALPPASTEAYPKIADEIINQRTLKGEDRIANEINISKQWQEFKQTLPPGKADELNKFILHDWWADASVKPLVRDAHQRFLGIDEQTADELASLYIQKETANPAQREALVDQYNLARQQALKSATSPQRDALNEYLIRGIWSEDTVKQVIRKKFTEVSAPVDIPPPKPAVVSKDDLTTAALELAAHKQAIEAPLRQLEQLATENVDFGRRALENGGYRILSAEDITKSIQNGGTPNFLPKAFNVIPDNFRRLLQAGDFQGLQLETIRAGVDPRELIESLRLEHNRLLLTPTPVNPVKPTKALTTLPANLYHGTALANWSPQYNLSVYGSRGELGSGLYLTDKPMIAEQYALARVSDNANPETLDFDLSPSVYSLSSSLERTLDARAKLPSNDDFYKRLAEGLPEELRVNLLKSISRAKTTTYSGFLTKLESNLVRSGLEPTEEVLQQVQKTVSDNLRRLGYDSVYDSKSGYALVLDNTKVNTISQQALQQTDEAGAALARYNADAYSSKFFPERLTTDANLRDSSMRLLNQVKQSVDNKLAQVQQELIQRGEDYEGILPELTEDIPPVKKPKTAAEILDDVDIDSICG